MINIYCMDKISSRDLSSVEEEEDEKDKHLDKDIDESFAANSSSTESGKKCCKKRNSVKKKGGLIPSFIPYSNKVNNLHFM